jgi:hypothetical protein
MENKRPNSIDWLFNQSNAKAAIKPIGARNLSQINVVEITGNTEKVHEFYYIPQGESVDFNHEVRRWINKMIKKYPDIYIYFRFIK